MTTEGGIANYTNAIKIENNYEAAYVNRGISKAIIGDYKGAVADYKKAIEIDPQDALAYLG